MLTIPAEMRTTGITRISWSTSRSGLLASLDKDCNYIRLWDIQESTNKIYPSSTVFLSRHSPRSSSDQAVLISGSPSKGVGLSGVDPIKITANVVNDKNNNTTVATPGITNGLGDDVDIPVLWRSRKSKLHIYIV